MTYRAYISKPDLNEMHRLNVYKMHIEQFLHVLETCEDERKCVLDASYCKGMLKDINIIINHMININKEGDEKKWDLTEQVITLLMTYERRKHSTMLYWVNVHRENLML